MSSELGTERLYHQDPATKWDIYAPNKSIAASPPRYEEAWFMFVTSVAEEVDYAALRMAVKRIHRAAKHLEGMERYLTLV